MFTAEITVGNIIAALAAIISAAAVLHTLSKDRFLREKELADKVRSNTAVVIAKLDRWRLIALHAIDELQPAATEVDGLFLSDRNVTATRDYFWKKIVEIKASMSKSILGEEIEDVYCKLYAYDPRIYELCTEVTKKLRFIGDSIFVELLRVTQKDILAMRGEPGPIMSAHLGNKIRKTLALHRNLLDSEMTTLLDALRTGLKDIICAEDKQLVLRSIPIPSAEILPTKPVSVQNESTNGDWLKKSTSSTYSPRDWAPEVNEEDYEDGPGGPLWTTSKTSGDADFLQRDSCQVAISNKEISK